MNPPSPAPEPSKRAYEWACKLAAEDDPNNIDNRQLVHELERRLEPLLATLAPTPTLADAAALTALLVELTTTFSVGSWKFKFHPDLFTSANENNAQLRAIILRHFGHLSGHQQAAGVDITEELARAKAAPVESDPALNTGSLPSPREAIERAIRENSNRIGDIVSPPDELATDILTALAPHLSPAPDANDTAMLDWLEKNARWNDHKNRAAVYFAIETVSFVTLRETVRAAMRAEGEKP